jgi:translation initiation factor IF-2
VVLTGHLKVGDTIEVVKGEARLRQKVSSMQIERQDVSEAKNGDDVGIKTDEPVAEGSLVYVVGQE